MKLAAPNRLTLIALILLGAVAVVCVMLGRWQLDRAAERREIAAVLDAGRRAPPVALTAVTPQEDLRAWRPAVAEGQWRS